jgi:3-deoxy-D-manno-octulosonate 8-phosphate phosphatase KdsC-like HAD superfamily phosphatase
MLDFSDVKIIVSEIDGVITDGNSFIDHMNFTLFKNFCNIDFEVINELKKHFVFVFLSSDSSVSYNIMRYRNIPTYFSNNKENKFDILKHKIMNRYGFSPIDLLYIGNRLDDISCMKYSEIKFTTNNSANQVKSISNYVFETAPGQGVLCELYDILISEIDKRIRNN